MIICNPRILTIALLVSTLPAGLAFAAGSGSRSSGVVLGAGVGAAGIGSSAVGGGAPAGSVGGGPPAGQVGGGSPGSGNPQGNGSAGTGNPSRNAVGIIVPENRTNAPGIPQATTTTGAIGGYGGMTGVAPAPEPRGGISPEALSKSDTTTARPTASDTLQGIAEEQAQLSTTGLAATGPDGVTTVTVEPRPCSVAAHGTDGTTTCIGVRRERR